MMPEKTRQKQLKCFVNLTLKTLPDLWNFNEYWKLKVFNKAQLVIVDLVEIDVYFWKYDTKFGKSFFSFLIEINKSNLLINHKRFQTPLSVKASNIFFYNWWIIFKTLHAAKFTFETKSLRNVKSSIELGLTNDNAKYKSKNNCFEINSFIWQYHVAYACFFVRVYF